MEISSDGDGDLWRWRWRLLEMEMETGLTFRTSRQNRAVHALVSGGLHFQKVKF